MGKTSRTLTRSKVMEIVEILYYDSVPLYLMANPDCRMCRIHEAVSLKFVGHYNNLDTSLK